MEGWVKLYRVLLKKPIWLKSTPEHKTILITLLLMANHEQGEWEWQGYKFKVEPGQFVTSIDSIVKECGKGISFQNVRSALKKFEKLGFLTNVSTKTGRLITIVNWEEYQANDDDTNNNTNKEVTKNQQRGNKEVTPNKNDKNDKNDKNLLKDSSLQIQNLRHRYSPETLILIDEYIEILKTTRVSGKIAVSVLEKVYIEMAKYPEIVVKYACYTIVNNPALHSKKENYFFGIMRNTKADEATRKLDKFYGQIKVVEDFGINRRPEEKYFGD
ncbi:MAG: hypothetical protein HPY74_19635 [Firmicutes bacterium]|nr:hypothetical protein [Bacillota bacterium]